MTREEVAKKIHWAKIIWLVGIVNPMFMLPQLWKIWNTGVVDGISIWTLIILFLIQAGFSTHGFFLRDNALFVSNMLAATVTFTVMSSTFYFGS